MTNAKPTNTINARDAGMCIKALYLRLTDAEASDPPGPAAYTRMETGRAMKDVVLTAMFRDGWEFQHGQPIWFQPAPNLTVRAVPERIGRHPEFTGNEWVFVHVDSAKESQFNRWLKQTSFKDVEHYRVHQLAMVVHAYQQHPEPPEQINITGPHLIAMLNRDTGVLEYELIDVEDLESTSEDDIDSLLDLSEALETETEPDAPFDRNSTPCRRCDFLTRCHGKPKRQPKSDQVTQEQINAALATIEELYDEVQAAKQITAKYDRAKAVIRNLVITSGNTDVTFSGETRDWTAHLEMDARVNISSEAARQLVSPAVMAQISTTSHVMTFGPADS